MSDSKPWDNWISPDCRHGEDEACGFCLGGPPWEILREYYIDEIAEGTEVPRKAVSKVAEFLDKHYHWERR